jgi:uncharacterized metal-binding protein
VPDGRTHDTITVVTTAFAAPLSWTFVFDGDFGATGLLFGSYLASSLFFSDDLDINSEEYHRWRDLRWLWWPYQRVVHHRSVLSHGFLIGPLLRLLYFAVILFILFWLFLFFIGLIAPIDASGVLLGGVRASVRFLFDHPTGSLLALIGFVLGGLTHSVADAAATFLERLL